MVSNQKERVRDLNSFDELNISKIIDPKNDQNIHVKVITTVDEFSALEEDWNNLVEQSQATIFQTFDWNKIWWKYFGTGNGLYIIAIFDDHRLVGIFPLFIDSISIAGIEIYSVLRLLGSTVSKPEGEDLKGLLPYSDYLDIIVRSGFEDTFCHAFLEFIQWTQLEYHQIILDEVPENSAILSHLIPLFKKHGINFTISDGSVCVAITLAENWQEYLADLSKRSRYNVRRFLKKAHHPEHKVFDIGYVKNADQMEYAFEQLVILHQQRWNKVGYPGTFAERRFYDFMKEVTSEFLKKGWAEFHLAKASESHEYIAVDLLFKFKKKVFLSQRAYDINAELNTHGPGNVLLYQGIKDAIGEGYEILDFMRGKESYKFRFGNDTRKNKTVIITNPDRFSSINDYLIRKMVSLKRRFTFEKDAVNILFSDKKFHRGLLDYFSFLQKRASAKVHAIEYE